MKQAALEPHLTVGEELELQIYSLAYGGEGIAKHQGMVIFVANTFPGDVVRVQIQQVKKRFARALSLELVTPSPDRIKPACTLAEKCGGCSWLQLAYPAQLKAKQAFVENALQHLGRIKNVSVLAPLKSQPPAGYRHKIQIPLQASQAGLVAGFYAPQTHQVITLDQCVVQPPLSNRFFRIFMDLARDLGYQGYDESTHQGDVRHLIIRLGMSTRELLAIVVTRTPELAQAAELAHELHSRIPELVGVVQNINPEPTNVILGKTSKLLSGRPFYHEEIRGIKYRISAGSFFQVNPYQLANLAEAVLRGAGLVGKETVVDLYSGVGFLSFELARKCRMVFGVEISESSVADAEFNKHLNGFNHTEFLAADALAGLDQLLAKKFQPEVLVLDPPRRGCEKALLLKIVEVRPKRVVYVSCNPVTLARDLNILAENGYALHSVQPIDLFPHTYHIESVAALVRKK